MNAQDRKLIRKLSVFGWFIAAATCIACPPLGATLVGVAFVAKGVNVIGQRRAANELDARIDAALAIVNEPFGRPVGYASTVAPQDAPLCIYCGLNRREHRLAERDAMVNHTHSLDGIR